MRASAIKVHLEGENHQSTHLVAEAVAASWTAAAIAAAASASLASMSEPTLTATDDVGDGGNEEEDAIAARGRAEVVDLSSDLCRCRRWRGRSRLDVVCPVREY